MADTELGDFSLFPSPNNPVMCLVLPEFEK